MADVSELRRVVRRLEGRRPPRPAPAALEAAVGGEPVETPHGPIVRVRRTYALGHRHGRIALADALAAPAELPRLLSPAWQGPFDPRRCLFLDAETTGLAGGTGTYAFLVGVGRVADEAFVVEQYFMRDFDEEPALLAALTPLLAEAGAIVSFNGLAFDVPLLETRFALARRPFPAGAGHLDLLRPARRVWGRLFEDCRLATLECRVLGLERADDVPGALIPSLYFDWLRARRPEPLARVFAHNRDDVLSLLTLLGWFGRAAGATAALSPEEWLGLGRLWEAADSERACQAYGRALAAGLEGPLAHWARLRLAAWEKRAARWEAACAWWQEALRGGGFDPRPWEELAKFHEHRRRDPSTARALTLRALALAETACSAARVREAFAYRLARLERRLTRRGT